MPSRLAGRSRTSSGSPLRPTHQDARQRTSQDTRHAHVRTGDGYTDVIERPLGSVRSLRLLSVLPTTMLDEAL